MFDHVPELRFRWVKRLITTGWIILITFVLFDPISSYITAQEHNRSLQQHLNPRYLDIDGSGNNGDQGVANAQLIRLFEPVFEDGIRIPRGGEISELNPTTGEFIDTSILPNPRTISNIILKQTETITNLLNASDWLWQWGQLLDHDLDLNEDNPEQNPRGEFTPIVIPQNDPNFEQEGIIPFSRVPAAQGTGETTPRQVTNQITAFIDASSVYGSNKERADFLRNKESGQGLLATSVGKNGEVLLPLNLTGDEALPNATGGTLGAFQFIAGDIRSNEQIGLTAAHNLLVREHNRIALDLHKRLESGDEDLLKLYRKFEEAVQNDDDSSQDDIKDDFLYQNARKVISAEVQIISYNEFLPLLIGQATLQAYGGFDSDISPQISAEFANAAFRLGHTLLPDQLLRVDSNGITETSLTDAFFSPENVQENGIDNLLTGLTFQAAQEVDNMIVDGAREFLFPARTGGLDLGAVNIARGREMGLPSYTKVYEVLFGTEITSFDQLGSEGLGLFSDSVVSLFEAAYETVDQIDLWLGGISELPDEHGGLLGPTLSYFLTDQFTRLRDGDEFFYLNDLTHLRFLAPDIENTTLSQVIRNNVKNPYLVPDNAFRVPFEHFSFGDDSATTFNGNELADLIDGQGGNDTIRGRGGDDILFGGLGNDISRGDGGNDKILGGDGEDTLLGNGGDDYLSGDAGNDTLQGGSGNDTIRGGTGSDRILGGGGGDTYVFGSDLRDGISDEDRILGFQAIDSFDFKDYLGAEGTIGFERVRPTSLQINLNREDLIIVFGIPRAINTAVAQLNTLLNNSSSSG